MESSPLLLLCLRQRGLCLVLEPGSGKERARYPLALGYWGIYARPGGYPLKPGEYRWPERLLRPPVKLPPPVAAGLCLISGAEGVALHAAPPGEQAGCLQLVERDMRRLLELVPGGALALVS